MNQEDLLNVIGEATEEMLEQSEKKTDPVKRIVFAAVAACLALVITILLVAPQQNDPEKDAKIIEEVFACAASTSFKNKDEYDAFMAADGAKLPDSFVTWEEVSVFGEVDSLVVLGESRFLYNVTDPAGVDLGIYVDPTPEIAMQTIVSMDSLSVDTTGLQKATHSHGKDVVVVRNGFEYLFRSYGNLYAITWYQDGVQVKISNCLVDYPKGRTDTLVGKLLSTDEFVANAAFAEIKEQLSK